MPGYRYAPSLNAVNVRRRGQAKTALHMQAVARREGIVVTTTTARGGARKSQTAIARIYFGRVLTARERKSLKKAGFRFSGGSYCGTYRTIPEWVWGLRIVKPHEASPSVAPDLKWEPGKKP